jgi:cytochrome c
MHKKIITIALIVFVGLILLPFVYNEGDSSAPEPVLTEKAKAAKICVAPTEFMRTSHMQLLNEWRHEVVRNGTRLYTDVNGNEHRMSLSSGEGSCMDCHHNKSEFCDKCHDYASVEPYCWQCHIEPEEKK